MRTEESRRGGQARGSLEFLWQGRPGWSIGCSIAVPGAESRPARLEHDESPGQILASSIHQIGHGFTNPGSRAGREAQKHDTGRIKSIGMNQLPEVLVLGEEDASFPKCKADHRLVVGSGRQIGDHQDLMSQPDQCADNCLVCCLIDPDRTFHRSRVP